MANTISKMLCFVILLQLTLACTTVYQSGVHTPKTSSAFGDFAKVDSCSPELIWEAEKPADYQAELEKALQTMDAKQQTLLASTAQAPAGSNPPMLPAYPRTITYDVAVHTVIKAARGHSLPPDRGERVFYAEGLTSTSVKVAPSLLPNTTYFWSVRTRLPDGRVSAWSTYSKDTITPIALESRENYWFGIKTPKECGQL